MATLDRIRKALASAVDAEDLDRSIEAAAAELAALRHARELLAILGGRMRRETPAEHHVEHRIEPIVAADPPDPPEPAPRPKPPQPARAAGTLKPPRRSPGGGPSQKEQVARWLLANPPAHSWEIAKALNLQGNNVSTLLWKYRGEWFDQDRDSRKWSLTPPGREAARQLAGDKGGE